MLITTFLVLFHTMLSGNILLNANNITNSSLSGCNETKEIQNLALRKPASQSSTYSESKAYHAVDGNKNSSVAEGSCANTDAIFGPLPHWWRVDLEQAVNVFYVVMYNPMDDFQSVGQLRNFTIEVGKLLQNGTEHYSECYVHTGTSTDLIVNLTCSRPMCGRFVQIMKQPTDKTPLTLCEVEIYGTFAMCTLDPSALLDDCPAPAVDTDLNHTTSSLVIVRTDEIFTYTKSPINTTKNEVTEFSLISSVGTMTAGQQLMPDTLRGRTSQSTLISTTVSDVIIQEGTDPIEYPQTSSAVEVVTFSSVSSVKYSLCRCRSASDEEKNTSAYLALKHRTEKLTKELVENLSIDKKTTARYIRKLRSVADDRPTAWSMGFVGVTFLILVGIVLIVNDIATAVIDINQKQSVKPKRLSDNP